MKAIQLTDKHKAKLLEMCKELFPEYSVQFGITQIFLPLSGLGSIGDVQHLLFHVKGTEYRTIHWFEFCMTYLVNKMGKSTAALYRILEEEETGTHPIDYLYSEFKKLKLCKH